MRKKYDVKNDLITIRKSKKLSRREVAEYLGISTVYYEKIEYGERGLSLDLAYKLSKYFHIDIQSLLNKGE